MAQAISLMGDWFSTIALSTMVVRYSGGSGLAVSILMLARFIPPLLVGPYAGVLVDRLNRKHLLILSDTMRTIIVLLFLFASGPQYLWLIYLLTVLQFCFSAVFEPGQSALIPSLVPTNDLVMANTLGSVTWSVMLAIGAAIGGAVAAVWGTPIALCVDSASFALSALFITTIRPRPGASFVVSHLPQATETHITDHPQRAQRGFMDGLRYIRQHPATAATLLIKAGGSISSVDVLMTLYAMQLFVLGTNGTESLGTLYGAYGIGAVLGPLLLNRVNDGSTRIMRRLVLVAYLFIAIGWFLFGAAPTLLLASLALVVKAMGSSVYWTYSSVILQKTVPDQFLGRMFSMDMWGFRLTTVISTVLTGWALDRLSGLAGFQLSTALGALLTGQLSDPSAGVRTVVVVTGLASVIPLILWMFVIPWAEGHDRREVAQQAEAAVKQAVPVAGD